MTPLNVISERPIWRRPQVLQLFMVWQMPSHFLIKSGKTRKLDVLQMLISWKSWLAAVVVSLVVDSLMARMMKSVQKEVLVFTAMMRSL